MVYNVDIMVDGVHKKTYNVSDLAKLKAHHQRYIELLLAMADGQHARYRGCGWEGDLFLPSEDYSFTSVLLWF